MNRLYLVASPQGFLSDLGWIDYAANASRFTLPDAIRACKALPGSWRLLDESFYHSEDTRALPAFALLHEVAA